VLGEMLAQLIEQRTGLTVQRRLNLGGTLVCDEALRRGDIDVYVEYTGTALTALFNDTETLSMPSTPDESKSARVLRRVRELYSSRGVMTLAPLGFDNTFAILVRGASARELALTEISDLGRVADAFRAGFGYEFLERPDGFAGLAQTYGLRFRVPPRVMDLNLIYRALAAGEIDVTAGDATSGLIQSLDLVRLVDDRQYFPPYDAVPLVNAASLRRHPELGDAIDGLAGRISAEDMQRLNHAVDGLRRDASDVVREFLGGLR
jgi:glycine betaine/choline ABC-type transport system substrate-binding protein